MIQPHSISDPMQDAAYREFRTRDYGSTIFNAACLMDTIAPKICCDCGSRLNIAELSYRFAKNIEPFLCYTCLKGHEANGTVILPSEEAGYPRKLRTREGKIVGQN